MLDADAGRYRLLYVSPERLISPAFIRFARRLDIRLLVVDEAHCISLWGYDFRPDYLRIPQFIRLMKKRPVIATFTASASAHVQKDVMEVLDLKNPFRINAGYRRENLRLAVYLQDAVNAAHPTLMRPITLVNERYNQHLTRGSLIIEVGSSGNTLQEATRAVRLFGESAGPALARLVQ